MDRVPGTLRKQFLDAVTNLTWVKIIGIGNASTGKTSLIKHFCESKFNSGYQPTVGVDYGFKIQEVNGIDLRVHLWDLSGSAEYFEVRNELYTGVDIIFLVYDVTSADSFEALDQWLREIKKYTSSGSEVDMKQKRMVTQTDGVKFAQRNKLRYFETSAASGEGVNEMFYAILRQVMADRKIPKSLEFEHESTALALS
ncbi:dnaJ homolog subfamily C member 27-like isoform X2 [Physella acuta]|uniref:dnaJ homolog subfamily C member 27-like isoform X2 n=1 Tax=Physella acuta TaxID=109671 RepID=UPI0027DAE5AA|nr:dnaJ homolog subfamily C member 27-like isoform X2 [Physella acuta]